MNKSRKILITAVLLLAAAGTVACGSKNSKEETDASGSAGIAVTEAAGTAATEAAEEADTTDDAGDAESSSSEETLRAMPEAEESETDADEDAADGEFSLETASYDDIIKHCTAILTSEDPWELEMEEDDPFTALFEVSSANSHAEALRSVGYTTWDYNSDGTDELIIGSMIDDEFDCGSTANQIYDIFTMDGDSAKLLFQGWSRNRCYLEQDDYFLNEGSSGASSSAFGEFSFVYHSDPCELTWASFYFTEYDDSDGKIHVYRNNDGSWDKDSSEEENITEERFWELENESEGLVYHMDLTSFSDYNMPVTVCTSDEYGKEPDTCTWAYLDSNYANQSELVLQAKEDVTDVKIYKLSFTDVDEEGNPLYDAELLYEQDELSPSLPLGIGLTFEGDMSSYGLSYVDADGNQRQYVLAQSGMDGSFYLSEGTF